MKRTIFALSLLSFLMLNSCEDGLTRIPKTKLSPDTYFRTAEEMELFTNRFYSIFSSIETYTERHADDITSTSLSNYQRGTRTATNASWSFSNLRHINYFLENSGKCEDEAVRHRYEGVAYFFRALDYYNKVVRYGNVPYYDHVIGSNDTGALTRPRDSRVFVMKRCVDDLDKAIEYLPAAWHSDPTYHVSKYAALALKARICLYEGTYDKYHDIPSETIDGVNVSWEWFLAQAVEASQEVIESGKYFLYTGNTLKLDPQRATPYREFFVLDDAVACETILSIRSVKALNLPHSTQFDYNSGHYSATKRFVDHYLFVDGTPVQNKEGWEDMPYAAQFNGRDPRMAQTILGPGYVRQGDTQVMTVPFDQCDNGYKVIKYMSTSKRDQGSMSESDFAFLRYPEVLLANAEAKAELGTLTQSDINQTINLIRKRAGIADLVLPVTPDPLMQEYYPNASGTQLAAILEVRRERTVEMFAEGLRLDDLLRWREGKWLTPSNTGGHQGIFIDSLGEKDLDGDGNPDVLFYSGQKPSFVSPSILPTNVIRIGGSITLSEGDRGYLTTFSTEDYRWNEKKDYLWPIPLSQIELSGGALSQNYGYESID